MKKLTFFSTLGLILALITFCLTSLTIAQPPSPPNLTGWWEFSVNNVDRNWWGEKEREFISCTAYITYIDPPLEPTEPNLTIDLTDSDDDFIGFAHDHMFSFYKENIDNCGGPDVNFGREIIVGWVNEDGTRMRGKGMGFDSNPDCGGTWSYVFMARKISE